MCIYIYIYIHTCTVHLYFLVGKTHHSKPTRLPRPPMKKLAQFSLRNLREAGFEGHLHHIACSDSSAAKPIVLGPFLDGEFQF